MDIETANNAIDYVSSYRASLGAQQNELEQLIRYNDTASENLASAESNITGEDTPAATIELSQAALHLQANMYVAKIANEAQKSVLQLLGGFVDVKI